MSNPIRVLLVDDDPKVRRGLRMRLRLDAGITVVGESGDGHDGVQQAVKLRPDVVVLDINLPTLDGLAACRQIRAEGPAVVFLSLEDADCVREKCLAAGASAFVSKQDPTPVLLAAIRAAVDFRCDPTLLRA